MDTSHDLLQDVFCESMLRWCFSGLFPFALAGPLSQAKLRPGGPKPLRAPEFPFVVFQNVTSSAWNPVVLSFIAWFRFCLRFSVLEDMFALSSLLQLFRGKILLFKIFWQKRQQFAVWFQLVALVLIYTRSGFSLHRFRICLSSLANATMLLGNMRIWSANAMNGAVFALCNLPCIQMVCVRQLFRLFGPCFRVVNLLWMFQLHISAIVFPRKEHEIRPILFRTGLVSLSAGLVGSAGNLDLCQGTYVSPCFGGSVSGAFLPDFRSMCNLARTRLCLQQTRLRSFGPSLLLGFSPPLVLLQWTGQCLRGSHVVCMLCSA